jgi:hypothetical protein
MIEKKDKIVLSPFARLAIRLMDVNTGLDSLTKSINHIFNNLQPTEYISVSINKFQPYLLKLKVCDNLTLENVNTTNFVMGLEPIKFNNVSVFPKLERLLKQSDKVIIQVYEVLREYFLTYNDPDINIVIEKDYVNVSLIQNGSITKACKTIYFT